MMLRILLVALAAMSCCARAAEPSRAEVVAAMKKATSFMTEQIAVNGGYVWLVSEDLKRRWGEVPARPSQIWLQGGTERMGQVFLDAYEATQDKQFLDAARRTALALIKGQHPAGGWHYFIDFDPAGIADWYVKTASRFRWGYEEYRHYYGNATYDDRVTADAATFLLRFHQVTRDDAYRKPLLASLQFVLDSQYPNGAWPQRFPLRAGYAHDGLPDYTPFYTLNDGATQAIVELLLSAHETLGDQKYLEAARRGVDALILLQGPEDQAGWAEQHGKDLKPATARTHEPAGYVIRESVMALQSLQQMYLLTGDARYLAPVPRCLAWFERVNREIAARKYPVPRYWEPGTNNPLYVVRTSKVTPEGYGTYIWTTDPLKTRCEDQPCSGDGKPVVDVEALRRRHEKIASLDAAGRAGALREMQVRAKRQPRSREAPADVIAKLDSRGAWVTDDNTMPVPVLAAGVAANAAERETIRGISTRVFVERMEALIGALPPP